MTSINYQKIISYAKRLEKKNLNEHGTSLSWNSLLNYTPITCTHHDSDIVDVEDNWKEVLKNKSLVTS